jgi:hypothetical protein
LPSITRSGLALSLPGEQVPAAPVDNSQGDSQEIPLRPAALSAMSLLQATSYPQLRSTNLKGTPTSTSPPTLRRILPLLALCRTDALWLTTAPPPPSLPPPSFWLPTRKSGAHPVCVTNHTLPQSTLLEAVPTASSSILHHHLRNNTNMARFCGIHLVYRCAVSGASSSARHACSYHQLHHQSFTTQQQQWFVSLDSILARSSYERPCAVSGAS